MIALNTPILDDEEANTLLEEHVNIQILRMMDRFAKQYNAYGCDQISATDTSFSNYAAHLLPPHADKGKTAYVFKSIYEALSSEDLVSLNPLQNYALRNIIHDEIEFRTEMEMPLVIPLPDRAHIKELFLDTCKSLLIGCYINHDRKLVIEEDVLDQQSEEFISELECIENYPDLICKQFEVLR